MWCDDYESDVMSRWNLDAMDETLKRAQNKDALTELSMEERQERDYKRRKENEEAG